jgi:ABC-type transporter Mla subunit MlaD
VQDTTKHARRKVQQVIEEAIQESDKILKEAQKEVDNIEGRTVQSARDQLRQFHERAEELEEQADDAQEAYKKTMRSILEAYEELSEEASGFEAEFEKSLKDAEEEMSKTMDQVANDLNTKAEGVNAKLNSVEKVRTIANVVDPWKGAHLPPSKSFLCALPDAEGKGTYKFIRKYDEHSLGTFRHDEL